VTVNVNLKSLCDAYDIKTYYRIYQEGQDANFFTITGHGVPHGIGLSQYGAQERAREGQDYLRILAFYYVGSTVKAIDFSNNENPDIWYGATIAKLNMRNGPSTSDSIITTLDIGARFQILEANVSGGKWFKIKLLSGSIGYVIGDYIMVGAKPAAPVITVMSYNTDPTLQPVIVNATTNKGTLNATSHTFLENGSFDFVATDAIGNVTITTVTIANIVKKGDVNFDNKITSFDALMALQGAVGKKKLSDIEKQVADVNNDGKITSADALKILKTASGK
jgi:hypothetical protein